MATQDVVAVDLAADVAACAELMAAVTERAANPALIEGNKTEFSFKCNKPGPGGATPLLVACLQGDAAAAAALLAVGADPTVEGDVWDTTNIHRKKKRKVVLDTTISVLSVASQWPSYMRNIPSNL